TGKPTRRYPPGFKRLVVETMQQDKLSYLEASHQFEVSDHRLIKTWERIYLTEGPEGLYVEHRGRKSNVEPLKLPREVEEDLLTEVQRLRAENEYLKKLQALVLEDERRQRRKRR
ncbi:MAG: transposase, partial [Bacteroidales bacterium]|nr:transposase [Bacteroidales bacterium]